MTPMKPLCALLVILAILCAISPWLIFGLGVSLACCIAAGMLIESPDECDRPQDTDAFEPHHNNR